MKLITFILPVLAYFSMINYHPEMCVTDNMINQIAAVVSHLSPAPENTLEYPRDAWKIKVFRKAANGLMHVINYFCNTGEEKEYYYSKSRREELFIPGPNGNRINVIVVSPQRRRTRSISTRSGIKNKDEILPLIVYYHGGGMVTGIPEDGHMIRLHKEARAVVVGVDYRLAPEHPFPEGIQDCYATLKYFVTNADKYAIDPRRVAVAGLSAGGLMTTAVAAIATHGFPDDPSAKLEYPLVAQIAIQPIIAYPGAGYKSWMRFASVGGLSGLRMQWFWQMYIDHPSDCNSYVCSPMLQTKEQLSKLPRAVIYAAAADVLRDEARHYAAMLREAGVPVDFYEASGSHMGAPMFDKIETPKMAQRVKELLNP